jgi:hypothetical protein
MGVSDEPVNPLRSSDALRGKTEKPGTDGTFSGSPRKTGDRRNVFRFSGAMLYLRIFVSLADRAVRGLLDLPVFH